MEEAEAHQMCDRGKLDADPIWWLQQSEGPPYLPRLGSADLPTAIFDRIVLKASIFSEIGYKDRRRAGQWVHIVVRKKRNSHGLRDGDGLKFSDAEGKKE